MAKMSLADLKKMRESKQKELQKRQSEGKDIEIIVGMATCGIAAGAKATMDSLIEVLEQKNIGNVLVRQSGCMGLCHSEPTVEVRSPDMPAVIYGNVDEKTAKEIVAKHIIEKKLLDNHVLNRPAADIIQNKE